MITFQGLIVSLILAYTKRAKCVEYNLPNYFLEVQDRSRYKDWISVKSLCISKATCVTMRFRNIKDSAHAIQQFCFQLRWHKDFT